MKTRIVFAFIMATVTVFMTSMAATAINFTPRFGGKWYLVSMLGIGAIMYGYYTYKIVKAGIEEDK